MTDTVKSLSSHTTDRSVSSSCVIAVLVCANSEWNVVRRSFPQASMKRSPFGEWFIDEPRCDAVQLIYFFAGCGKTSAAAATQHVIDHWDPSLILNVGTCGGFGSGANVGTLVIPERTTIYDIDEKMGDAAQAIRKYSSKIDTSWLAGTELEQCLHPVLVSADRDVSPEMVFFLEAEYGAIAADWESGAIAYVASLNSVKTLIVRAVSDIVTRDSGEAYGNHALFESRCETVMGNVIERIPSIVEAFIRKKSLEL